MYFAQLKPFNGEDEIVSAEDFRTIYNLTMSEARAMPLGVSPLSWRVVWVMKEREDLTGSDAVCGIFNWGDGTIDAARPDNIPGKAWRVTVSDRRPRR